MFKRKKQQEGSGQSAVINPIDVPELPQLPPQQFQQPTMQDVQYAQQRAQQQPVYQEPIYQEQVQPVPVPQQVPQQPVQQVQQPAQPVQQTQPTAYVVQAAAMESGVFRYVIDTNYPLAIGNCIITQ